MAESILQTAFQQVSTSSTKLRVAIFRASISSLLDNPDENPADYAVSLTDLLFETLHLYHDRRSQAAVEFVLVKAFKDPPFVKVFAAALIQRAEKVGKSATVSVQYKLLRWSCLLLRWNPGILAAKTALTRLMTVQGPLVFFLFQSSFRVRRSTRRIFSHMLSEVQGLFDLYMNELKGTHLRPECACGLISALLDYCSRDAILFENHKGLFLDLYIKIVLGAKEKLADALSLAFTPLMKKLTHEDFGRVVVPNAVKMLKRNPELVLEAVGIILNITNLDLSKYVGDLLPVLLVQARHNDENRRKESATVISHLAMQSSDPDAIALMFDITKSVLGGSEGKLSFPYQRVGIINSLHALASAPGGKTMIQLAATVCGFLISYYQEDGNEEVRGSVLSALGMWISRAGEMVPESARALFIAGLKEKETLRRSHLRCLRMGLRNSSFCSKMHTLVDSILNLSKNWVTKPSQRVDSIYALLILFQVASVDVKADDKIVKEKLWSLVLQKDSTVFSTSLVSKLSVEDCVTLVELIEVIMLKHSSRLAESGEGSGQLYQLLALSLWHPSTDVRKVAFEAVRRAHLASAKFSKSLFDGFSSWLPILEDQMVLHRVSDVENSVDGSSVIMPSAEGLAKALMAVAVPALFSDCHVSARILIVCHHQCLVKGCPPDTVWKVLTKKLKGQGFDFTAALAANPSALCEIMLGSSGLLNGRISVSQAALHALHTLMQTIPLEFFPSFRQHLEGLINRTAHDELTEHDIEIFNTPVGMLSTERGVYVAEVVADKNIKHAKGRFRMYDNADNQESAKQILQPRQASIKKEASSIGKKDASKPSKKSGESDKSKSAKEEAKELQLKEEAVVREKVYNIKECLSLGLNALGEVVSGNPVIAHEELPYLAECVTPLLKSQIVSTDAYAAMVKLAGCVAPSLRHLAADLAAARNIIITSPLSILHELEIISRISEGHKRKPGVIERIVAGLVVACKEGPLPSPSFAFVYPIMEQVLLSPKNTSLHDDLLEVIALHTSTIMTLPRLRMLDVLYHVLGCIPGYQGKIQPVLCELCSGLKSDELPDALIGLYSKHSHVRAACLYAIKFVPALKKRAVAPSSTLANTLWMGLHDPEKSNTEAAEEVWDLYNHDLGNDFTGLFSALSHSNYNVRLAASQGLASAMYEYPNSVQETLSTLFSLYVKYLPSTYAEVDPSWTSRQGVALALCSAADVLTVKDLPVVATFLISRALADPNTEVRARMVDAGIAIIDKQGKDNVGLLLPIFENYLDKKAADEEQYDLVREGVVIFMGALAKHLSMDDPKISVIVEKLLEVLKTPSEAVQRAVSECLPPLMQSQQNNAQELISRLLKLMMQSDKYGERRGAAFGLAGAVKGLGLSSLKKYGIMDALRAGVEDRNSAKVREGALFGFECLCEKLGRLFEPYVIHILPLLLVCFSDQVVAVREATDSVARAIMAQLSGQGVKLVLPALLKGLEDKAWRTKQGSVQMLGAMAFCAPRQLSQCLPTIVPKLTEVLTDTHPKVQAAAQTALQQIGSVIRNPEISALVPTLLLAISDPNEHTKHSLDVLLQTTFVNTVDAPSLALIVPIVHRGLRERSSETKKKAAQIVGNMCSLVTEPKDMLPYLCLLLPEVKKVLVDPIPEVRTVAAKALGSLIKGMGEENFRDLVPWLLETLKSETSGVERSGAAQGLSEVLAALGTTYFESLLPDIIQNCSHQRAAVRDGYLTLFKYLPMALGPTFQKYLQRVLPAILDGLADENESVRDAALGAGHVFVEHYATTSLPLLLPAVEEGIFNDNWRIRQSSVELLGDLLFKVAGTSGKVVLEGGSDDEGASTEAHGRAIVDVLGKDRRNEVLAAVYMVRSDVSLTVRQAALHVWKTVVANTPKTLKEIMPVLMSTLIASLASTSSERRQVAGRSLGELVRKLGDRVLPSIIPILSQGLEDASGSTRQGVCIGLSEVMASAGKHQLVAYMDSLIPTIRDALCDSVPEVREAAGLAFSTLFKSAGMQAVDEIVPNLLQALEDDSTSATALDGLKQILSVRTAAVLPHILPKLVKPPLTAFNAHALGALAEVAGAGLNQHLSIILSPLISAMGDKEQSVHPFAKKAAETVVMVIDEEGIDMLMSELMRGLGDTQVTVRRGSAYLVGFLFKNSKLDLAEEVPDLITTLVVMLTDLDSATVEAAWEALSSVTGTIPKENLPSYVKVLRDAVSTARDKERRKRKGLPITVPGFCLPKALQPVLPIFLQGLMSGSAELREQAAEGLGELIDVTSVEVLKPFVVPITGPLIRIIGDRFPWQVKSAILATLGIIISKGGIALKPFLPQLQTTFIKCLQDNTRAVRSRAAWSLGKLTSLSARVDPLVGDLLNGLQSSEGGVKEAMLVALKGVLKHAGKNLSMPVVTRVVSTLQNFLPSEDDEIRGSSARALGMVSQYLGDEELRSLVQNLSAIGNSPGWTVRHGAILSLSSIIRHSAAKILTSSSSSSLLLVLDSIKDGGRDDKVPVRESAAKALGRVMAYEAKEHYGGSQYFSDLVPLITMFLKDDSSDVRRRALSSLKSIAKSKSDALAPYIGTLGPVLADLLKDASTPVRLAAERCTFHVLQLNKGPENVQASEKYLTGLDARRISKQSEQSDASEDSEEDSLN